MKYTWNRKIARLLLLILLIVTSLFLVEYPTSAKVHSPSTPEIISVQSGWEITIKNQLDIPKTITVQPGVTYDTYTGYLFEWKTNPEDKWPPNDLDIGVIFNNGWPGGLYDTRGINWIPQSKDEVTNTKLVTSYYDASEVRVRTVITTKRSRYGEYTIETMSGWIKVEQTNNPPRRIHTKKPKPNPSKPQLNYRNIITTILLCSCTYYKRRVFQKR